MNFDSLDSSSILRPDSRDGHCGSRVRLVLCNRVSTAVIEPEFCVLKATKAVEACFKATAEFIFFTHAGNELNFGGNDATRRFCSV